MPIDYEKYPKEWRDIIRPDILRRANYKCENCGLPNRKKGYRDSSGFFLVSDYIVDAWAEKRGMKKITIHLSIAHLDHNRENNNYTNLKAMCQQCHNRHDAQYRGMNRRINRANKTSNTQPS